MVQGISQIKLCVEFVDLPLSVLDKKNYLNRMLNQLTSRGPDAEGIYS
jgi:asparagine synthetase B (glutamine-hydrolysing)